MLTKPQFSVEVPPTKIEVGDAVNEAMLGVPLQPLTAGGAGLVTLILTVTLCPKSDPLALRSFHCPVCKPGAAGAVMGTLKSADAPTAVFGTWITVVVAIASPFTKTN